MKLKKDNIIALFFIFFIFAFAVASLALNGIPYRQFVTRYIEINDAKVDHKNLFEKLDSATQAFEITLEDNVIKKPIIEVNGLYQRLAGKRALQDAGYGEIYQTNSGQVIFAMQPKDAAVAACSEQLIQFKKSLDEVGLPLLYVQAPFKLSGDSGQLPRTKIDYSDYNIDRFLNSIAMQGVPYLDLRPLLFDGEKTRNELFYNTDHHWKIATAFEACGHVERHLNANYGFAIDPFFSDIENYRQQTIKNCFLGSMGRRTGFLYAGLDDFTLITPKFDTSIRLEEIDDPAQPVISEGTFSEAVLDMQYLDAPLNVYQNRYAVYHGDNRELIFHNNNVDSGKILLIKDSFGIPVYSFMSLGVAEIRALDLRFFKDSVIEYAKTYRPDVVIVLYNGDAYSDIMFNFQAVSND